MANRRLQTVDVYEVIRLKRLGKSHAEIGRLVSCSQPVVRKYIRWAGREGLLDGALPDPVAVGQRLGATLPEQAPPQQTSTLAAFSETVRAMRQRGMEIAAIRQRLVEQHGEPVSYEALRRLVRRLERAPGEEAQVDFGYAGLTIEPATGQLRKTWVFVMLLSFSRHLYAELVYDQTVATWLECHRRAFAFFGGVPARIVLDNLRAAILSACRTEPVVQRSYRELAGHYGFLIDPNPPARPNLKGKVEQGGVHYVKRNFLAGRDPELTDRLNEKLRLWCREVAGARCHGTTRVSPLVAFEAEERAALLALPAEPYELAVWKQVKLHRDGHVTFEQAFYSAPFRLVGQAVWVRGTARTVKIYSTEEELVAVHDRAPAGGRRTCLDHLPAGKVAGLTLSRSLCREQATAVGPATHAIVERLLTHRPEDKLRVAGRVLALVKTYGAPSLEAACRMALEHGEGDYPTVKAILAGGLTTSPALPPEPARRLHRFARSAAEYMAAFRERAA
jgi:transposase